MIGEEYRRLRQAKMEQEDALRAMKEKLATAEAEREQCKAEAVEAEAQAQQWKAEAKEFAPKLLKLWKM